MKRRWIVVSALTAVVALGISGGAVLAQTAGPNGDSPVEGMISRVASILGLEKEQVQDAFDEAVAGMRAEKIKARLDALEENGRITSDQRDDLEDWINSMPEGLGHGFGVPGFNLHKFRGGPKFGGPRMHGKGFRGRGFPGRGFQTPPAAPQALDTTSL